MQEPCKEVMMKTLLDLERFPIDDLATKKGQALIASCKRDLSDMGMFNLEGFVKPSALARMVEEVAPVLKTEAFTHARRHNIYFEKDLDDVPAEHPVRIEFETSNKTICADQIPDSLLITLYEWHPFRKFLAEVLGKPVLHMMADPLARANVMSYTAGQALNWHFDRSEFTTTLLLQAPEQGGDFQYRMNLRSDDSPNYNGVARMLAGEDDEVRLIRVTAGTLNVFRGKNTAHRTTPVVGNQDRIIAVFSFFEEENKVFSDRERIGFYGRAG